MKINKKGTHSSSSVQNLIFHSRKNSASESQVPSGTGISQVINQLEKQFGVPSDSQPVLKKVSDFCQEKFPPKPTSRPPSCNNMKEGVTECLNSGPTPNQSIAQSTHTQNFNKHQGSLISHSNSTKHSCSSQLALSKVDQSKKENMSSLANSAAIINSFQNQNSHNVKSSTMKFSINNLLNEISNKQTPVQPNKEGKSQQKSHQSIIQMKNHQHLSTSKMMMAFHKKCNSISNSTNSNILNASVPKQKYSNQSCVETPNNESEQVLDKSSNQNNKKIPNKKDKSKSKNVSCVSQVEFFDENVRVGEVPSTTPRQGHSKKPGNQNERYKESQEALPKSTYKSVPLAVLADYNNRQAFKVKHPQQQPQQVIINLNHQAAQIQKPQSQRRAQEEMASKRVFDMKRRSCGEVDQHANYSEFIENRQNDLSTNENSNNAFAQRKYSHQVSDPKFQQQNSREELSKSKIIVRTTREKPQMGSSSRQQKNIQSLGEQLRQKFNPKDHIIDFIGKYIKSQNNRAISTQQMFQTKEYEETLDNLREFLSYLEDRKIINPKKLKLDSDDMNSLIEDLMKLDLKKFSKKKQNSQARDISPETKKSQQPNFFENKRYSQEHIPSPEKYEEIQQIKCKSNAMSPDYSNNKAYNSGLPVNSPVQGNQPNMMCYYSPLNVNGNGNIVNHNVQIYPPPQSAVLNQVQMQGKFHSSQKLFGLSSNENSQESQQIPLRVDAPLHSQHKRVNSMIDPSQINLTKTPVVLNNKVNFGFGGQSSQKLFQGDQSSDSTHPPKPLFHQRKNSMFVQQNEKILSGQQQQNFLGNDSQEDYTAVEQNKKHRPNINHRRSATNYIQPSSASIQTLQPQPIQTNNKNIVFNDDIGMIEDRDKLIKYIQLYSKQKNEIPGTTLDYYKFVKLIGKGAFGKVTLGYHKLTGKQVAIKTVDKSLMKDEYQRNKVMQEVFLLKKVRHSNVIRLLEVFESSKHLLMVMEYAGGGDLLQYVKKKRRLEESEAKKIFRQIVYGLAHCHCRSVLHRDIKLDNILIDNDGEIKICDFGVSRVIGKTQRINEQCGTPAYIAPEIISDSGYEGFSADIWSLGVLLYAMVCGTVPFKAQNMHDLHQIITCGQFSFPSQMTNILSGESKDLISRMILLNPKDRITIPEILSHPWLISKDEFMMENDTLDFENGMSRGDFMMNTNNSEEPDINQVNIDNLFPTDSYNTKLSYTDYLSITQDFATMHMDEEALQVLEGYGYPRSLVKSGLNKGELNHSTASYNLLVMN